MEVSDRGLDLIKRFEGLELEAYQDVVGIWTIGYGHTSMAGPPDVKPGMEITKEEAENILRRDLGQYENAVEKAVKVPINQNMFDALTSITYNIGVNGMKSSTFIKRLNNRDYEGAAEAMLWWNKAGGKVVQGLKSRREAEASLFLENYQSGDDIVQGDVRGMKVNENSPRRGNLAQSRTMSGAGAAGLAGSATVGSVLVGGSDEGETDQASEEAAEHPAEPSSDAALPPLDEIGMSEAGAVIDRGKDLLTSTLEEQEGRDAIIMVAGVLAVLAAIYVMLARVDDWRNHKR